MDKENDSGCSRARSLAYLSEPLELLKMTVWRFHHSAQELSTKLPSTVPLLSPPLPKPPTPGSAIPGRSRVWSAPQACGGNLPASTDGGPRGVNSFPDRRPPDPAISTALCWTPSISFEIKVRWRHRLILHRKGLRLGVLAGRRRPAYSGRAAPGSYPGLQL